MGQFRRYFSGGETLHQVEALHPFLLVPHPLDLAHILKGGIQRTANGRAEQVLLGFILVEGIVHRRLQGVCVLGAGGFFLIQNVVHAIVQAVHGIMLVYAIYQFSFTSFQTARAMLVISSTLCRLASP